jgi:hypothetical protein
LLVKFKSSNLSLFANAVLLTYQPNLAKYIYPKSVHLLKLP